MISGKEKIISILAISVLLLGIFSALYVNATQINKDTITINGNEYTLNQIFLMCNNRSIETDEGEKTGVALDQLITAMGVVCVSCNKYIIKGSGNYQQTIEWDIFKTYPDVWRLG